MSAHHTVSLLIGVRIPKDRLCADIDDDETWKLRGATTNAHGWLRNKKRAARALVVFDDADPQHGYVCQVFREDSTSFVSSSVVGVKDVDFAAQRKVLREFLEPQGFWDEDAFGVWAFGTSS